MLISLNKPFPKEIYNENSILRIEDNMVVEYEYDNRIINAMALLINRTNRFTKKEFRRLKDILYFSYIEDKLEKFDNYFDADLTKLYNLYINAPFELTIKDDGIIDIKDDDLVISFDSYDKVED